MKALTVWLSAAFFTILMPICLLDPVEPPPPEAVHIIVEQPGQSAQTVRLLADQQVLKLPLEEYLIGVVFAEMPASFELEALKAQAVAARTFTLCHMQESKHQEADVCGDSSCCQAWLSREEQQARMGAAWPDYYEKIRSAVYETAGEVLTYQHELIDAVYFSCSGGSTEDAAAVWGSDIPYLQSVSSEGEEACRKYVTTVRRDVKEVREVLQEARPNGKFPLSDSSWIHSPVLSEGGGVSTIMLGDQSFRGTELRALFGLNSAKFTISMEGSDVVFTVYGYGHRVGMSQYGANAMAQCGKTYREILSHYYTDTLIETKNP